MLKTVTVIDPLYQKMQQNQQIKNSNKPSKDPEHYYDLGNKLTQRSKYKQATAAFEKALALKANYPEAQVGLGTAQVKLKRFDEAISAYQLTIALDPNYYQAYFNLGLLLQNLEKSEAAISIYQQGLAIKEDVSGYNNLGAILFSEGRLDQAIDVFKKAIALDKKFALAYSNLGGALLKRGNFDEAIQYLDQAISLDPTLEDAYIRQGLTLSCQTKYTEAIEVFNKNIEKNPQSGYSRFGLALVQLTLGQYQEGWKNYEYRWEVSYLKKEYQNHAAYHHLQLKPGDDLCGKTIVLLAEQGLGDTLQFIRYVSLVIEQGASVIVGCPPSLRRLFRQIKGIKEFLQEEKAGKAFHFDYFCHLLSLPNYFGTTLETVPADIPYLTAEAELIKKWQPLITQKNDDKKIKIGLVWAGDARKDNYENVAYYMDLRRSLHLSKFSKLANIPETIFYSLQKGGPSQQVKEVRKQFKIIDYTDKITDFADTAALIANLDLVISVDTSVAHLAGAMGKPVWILSRFDGCWRWLNQREDNPWYPTARIFHQKQPGDWDEVIDRLVETLEQVVKEGVHSPLLYAQTEKIQISEDPTKNAEYYYDLGNTQIEQAKYNVARIAFEKAILLKPNYSAAQVGLGNALTKLNKIDEATEAYQLAIALDSNCYDAFFRLGVLLQGRKHIEAAIPMYQQAIACKETTEAYNNLGVILTDAGRLDEAIVVLERAISLDDHYAISYNNLGAAFIKEGQFAVAVEYVQRAVDLDSTSISFLGNLAVVYCSLRKPQEAIEIFKQALVINPNSQFISFNYSLALLLAGNYQEGWKYYETRLQAAPLHDGYLKDLVNYRHYLQPGDNISGKIILLICEQGLGDALQFIRYLPLLIRGKAIVILKCHKELKKLFSQIPGIKRIVTVEEKEVIHVDYFCYLLSLPYFFQTTIATIPTNIPYLNADIDLVKKWSRLISKQKQANKIKVGLVWAGAALKGYNNNTSYYIDLRRSLHLSRFLPLAKIAGVVFYSLQKGEARQQIKEVRKAINIIDYTDQLIDFSETAALIANLDLVITVDTAVAHLTGALGKPVWILNRYDACWRWLIERNDSPWYPTARLFCQKQPGAWEEVIEHVAIALESELMDVEVTR